ncbi:MAG: hypothetical protein O3A66_01210, partial [Proteobacteria bacterium]|nr:hypothetical protein [Pseudomonadota bacterium]
FQNQNYIGLYKTPPNHHNTITKSNLIDGLIYLAVRWAVPATWLNDRDQLLHPKKTIKTVNTIQQEEVYDFAQDEFFIGNCVVFSLLHRQNGTAWQLFKNSEIGLHGADRDLTVWNLATKGREFSPEAQSLMEISRKVYTLYYKTSNNFNAGRNDIWQALKDNDDFKKLNKEFLECQKILAGKIAEGMIEFGFLRI